MIVKSIFIADDNSEWDCKEHAIARDEYLELKKNLQIAEKEISTRRFVCKHPVVTETHKYIEHDPLCSDEEYYVMRCQICEHEWCEDVNRRSTNPRKVIKRKL